MSSTIRTHKRSHYTQIDNNLLDNPNISLQAKGLQAYLLSKPSGWNISSRHLATTCTCGVDKVQSTLRELESIGYIRREKVYGLGGRIEWVSHIYESLELNPHLNNTGLTMTGLSSHGSTSHGSTSHGSTSHGESRHIVKTKKVKTKKVKTEAVNTHIDPDRTDEGKSADASVCVNDCLEIEILESELEQVTSPAQPSFKTSSLAVSVISGEGESSDGCSMILDRSMSTISFDERVRSALTPTRIAETASKILSMYNAGKPLYWKSLGVVQKPLRTKCESYIRNYLQEGNTVDDAITLFEDDFKYAIIGLKTSDFHTGKDFQNGNIYWLFDKDRIYTYAGTGRSLTLTEQIIVAQKLVSDVTAKVIYDFHSGKVLSETSIYFRRDYYQELIEKQDPDAPTVEYLRENFPELLAN